MSTHTPPIPETPPARTPPNPIQNQLAQSRTHETEFINLIKACDEKIKEIRTQIETLRGD
jgi:hypothetical protein